MSFFLIIAATLFLAWSNGANDNFKGVATLYGSGTVSFRTALACVSTEPGGVCRPLRSPGTGSMALNRFRPQGFERLCDIAHFASAGTVSFARGLNDAPKIAGIALAAGAFDVHISIFAIAVVMALGGLIHARRVAETMSHKITSISHEQGIAANMVTSLMVLFASRFGVPVSTTHVSVGAILGIGVARGDLNISMVRGIVLAWVLTLPLAMGLSALIYFVLKAFVG